MYVGWTIKTTEFMLTRQLLWISDWSFSHSDLFQCIFEACT